MSRHRLPERLIEPDNKINLFYLHETFRSLAGVVSDRLREERGIDIPITSGMWGGSYLIADDYGKARTNVVRLYCLINLPQGTPLDDKKNFEHLIEIYHRTFRNTFLAYNLDFVDPQWGEPVPYSNRIRPTTTLQMWDKSQRVKFLRAFFVWNTATWEESVIYDAIRNIKQLKELLDLNQRPGRKEPQELKFLLQDILITYFTLYPALSEDFVEHAEPIIQELFRHFLNGMYDEELIEDQFHKVYANALVYGYQEALEAPYKKYHLDIHKVEDWPVEKINWVPPELKQSLGTYLKEKFSSYESNLQKDNRLRWKNGG